MPWFRRRNPAYWSMGLPETLVVHAAAHPNEHVRRVGFGLDDAYVERCWTPVVGPTSVLLLRRLPEEWQRAEPARLDLDELGRSLGVGGFGGGASSRVWRTVERLASNGLARWAAAGELAVYGQVAPRTDRQLRRLPTSTQAAHDRLLAEHAHALAVVGVGEERPPLAKASGQVPPPPGIGR